MPFPWEDQRPELGYDRDGVPIPALEGHAGWLLQELTEAGPWTMRDAFDDPWVVPMYTTTEELRRLFPGFVGRLHCVPTDRWGQEIPGAPVGVVDIEPPLSDADRMADKVYDFLLDHALQLVSRQDEMRAMLDEQTAYMAEFARITRQIQGGIDEDDR